jgi:hypothetical protein
MVFHLIPLYTRIMFIAITVLECFLALMLLRWDAWKRYPVMSAYLTVQGVGGLAALLTVYFGTKMLSFYTNYGVAILVRLIAFGVALELYYKIFDPRIGLFAWGRRHVVIIISVSLGVAITLGFLFAARNGGSLSRKVMTLEAIMSVALWATFCTLSIYSRSLGFIWRPRVRGIAMGFILYLTASVICNFIAMRFSYSAGMIANQVGPAVEFLVMAWWLGVFWGEEKPEEKLAEEATPRQIDEMVAKYIRTVEETARQL